jgi:hypothetical protein
MRKTVTGTDPKSEENTLESRGERVAEERILVHGTQMIQSRDQNPGSATADRWEGALLLAGTQWDDPERRDASGDGRMDREAEDAEEVGGVVVVGGEAKATGEGGLVISARERFGAGGRGRRTTWHAVPGLTRGAHVGGGAAPALLLCLPPAPGLPDRHAVRCTEQKIACKSHREKRK